MRTLLAMCLPVLLLASCQAPTGGGPGRYTPMPGSTTSVGMVLDSLTGDVFLVQASIPDPIVVRFPIASLALMHDSEALRDKLAKVARQAQANAATQPAPAAAAPEPTAVPAPVKKK